MENNIKEMKPHYQRRCLGQLQAVARHHSNIHIYTLSSLMVEISICGCARLLMVENAIRAMQRHKAVLQQVF